MTFKIGDVVYLTSGGPAMTVTDAREVGVYEASWFTNSGELRAHCFESACLQTPADAEASEVEAARPRSIM
jgi:uncharacterized protein YodC (DUF2158 family)